MGPDFEATRKLVRSLKLNTVCEEARCPNLAECWGRGTATFMILGDVCTRACAFCAVTSGKRGGDVDLDEPARVARAVQDMGVAHAVVTSVDRDDLPDFGASIFALTIEAIHELCPGTTIEVLTPDFNGRRESVQAVMEARPDIFNHNVETVPRLYRRVRPKAGYQQSLDVLAMAREIDPSVATKSGLMLGLGEELSEVVGVLADLRAHGVSIVTLGQYLRPSPKHHPIVRFATPEEFVSLKEQALEMGFSHVESGPLVRSSYHADEQIPAIAP